MEPDEKLNLRAWMEQRFDRIDDQLDRETQSLAEEIKSTRHGINPVLQQLAIQASVNLQLANENKKRIDKIDDWREPEGPLDSRLKRHSTKQADLEGWRNRVLGALGVVMFLFPLTLAAVLKYG